MATRDLRGLTIEIGGDTSSLTDALRDVDGELSNLQSNLRTVNSALKLDPGNVDALAQRQELLNDAVETTTRRLDTLRETQRQVDRQIASGVEVDQRAYRNLQVEIVRAEASLNDYQRQTETTGGTSEQASEGAVDGWSMVKEVLAELAKEALQALIEAFKDLIFESEKAFDLLQAKTGASAKQMQKYGDVAEEVFSRGIGESIADVTDAVATITNMLGDLDEVELRNVTENAMSLQEVFGWDIQESIRAAKSLMDQFGITSDEAFNLMIQGAQNGLDQNGDLLDVINEYSVQFRDAGYSADDMFNMLANGADTGTWSIDKLGDAVKEFNIRASDGTAHDALIKYQEAVGLTEEDIKNLTSAAAEGGEAGAQAMGQILQAILDIEDPTQRYSAGVAVFGTMWEDLGETAVAALFNTEGAIVSTNDAMGQVKTDAYDNLATSVSALGRTLKTEILTPIVEEISPVIKGIVDWAIENMDTLKPAIIGISVALGIVTAAIVAAKVATIALTAAMNVNPIFLLATIIIAGIMGVASAIASLVKASDTSGAAIKANAEAVTAFGEALENTKPNILDASEVLSAYGRTVSEIDGLISEVENEITTILSTALAEQRQLREDELASIAEYNEKLRALQEEKLATYRQAMTVEVMKIGAEAQTLSQEQTAQYLANMQAALDQANEVSTDRYNDQLAQIYNFHQAQGTLNSQAYLDEVAAAKAAYEQELADSQAYYNEGLALLQEHANQWVQSDRDKWNAVIAATNESKGQYKDALAQIDLDNANAFLSMYMTTLQRGGEITEETETIARAMLAAFNGLPNGMEDAGKDALLGIISGMEDEIPGLENASEMTAQEIVDVLCDYLQIQSPSRVTKGIGENVSEGINVGMQGKQSLISRTATGIAGLIFNALRSKNGEMNGVGANMIEGVEAGIQSKKSWIGTRISSFASGLVSSFKKAFNIQSPSRVMRDQIGAMLAEGIGVGIEENADEALKPMEALKEDLSAFDGLNVSKSIQLNADSAQSEMKRLAAEMREVYDVLAQYLPYLAKKTGIYVDKKRLVGELAPDMDEALGDIANRRAVGAV